MNTVATSHCRYAVRRRNGRDKSEDLPQVERLLSLANRSYANTFQEKQFHIFVLCVVCYVRSWQLLLCIYLINSMEMKKRIFFCLFVQCLTVLPSYGIQVLDLTAALQTYPQNEYGYWTDTYLADRNISQGIFRFSHTGSPDAGLGMAYWDGFTLCTNSETDDYGNGGSDGWIKHQWGCMAGGGLNEEGEAEYGTPYLVGYWGYSLEQTDNMYHSLQVDFTDNRQHKAVGVYICNHPWPYYGNIHGDGFAQQFKNEGDRFTLVAHGLNQYGESTGTTAELTLAEFTDGELHQSDQWEYFDLTALGTVNGIYFTMQTTDESTLYGANTAVYFCLCRLSVTDDEQDALSRPTGLQVTETEENSLTLTWNGMPDAERYLLLLDGVQAGTSESNVFVFSGLQPYTEYALSVIAVAGTKESEAAVIHAMTADETAPEAPDGLQAEPSLYSIALSWQPATDNVGVTRYTIWVNGVITRRINATAYTLTGLEPATEYLIEVAAQDASGNLSERTAVRVSTASLPTGMLEERETSATLYVYTIGGMPIGNDLPAKQGVYVVKRGRETRKIAVY